MIDCYFINTKDGKIPTQNWSLQTGAQPARGWNVSGLSRWLPNGLMNLPVSRCWLNFQNFVQIDKCTEMVLVCSFVWVCSSAQVSLEMKAPFLWNIEKGATMLPFLPDLKTNLTELSNSRGRTHHRTCSCAGSCGWCCSRAQGVPPVPLRAQVARTEHKAETRSNVCNS